MVEMEQFLLMVKLDLGKHILYLVNKWFIFNLFSTKLIIKKKANLWCHRLIYHKFFNFKNFKIVLMKILDLYKWG